MSHSHALIIELDAALGPQPGGRSATILRRVTDLYLTGDGAYSDEQVSVFDDVMLRLADMVDRAALIELSERLAAFKIAPLNTVLRLLRDADKAVCGPVLEHARAVPERELLALAKTADAQCLTLIVRRRHVTKTVTDAICERNIPGFARKVLANPGAEISHAQFAKFIGEAAADPALARMLATRTDLPDKLRPLLNAHPPKN